MPAFKKVTLPYEDFADLYTSLQVISTRSDLEMAYAIARNLKLSEKLYIEYRDTMFDIQQKFVRKHPDGRIVTNDQNEPQYVDKEAADKAFKDFNSKDVTFEVYEIHADKYSDKAFSKLTPMMIKPLLDIIIVETEPVTFKQVVGQA